MKKEDDKIKRNNSNPLINNLKDFENYMENIKTNIR